MTAVDQHQEEFGVAPVCEALGVWPSTWYRRQRRAETPAEPRPTPVRGLSDAERTRVHDMLNSDEFADKAPAAVFATLLSRGEYLCSVRTMYRILAEHDEVRERRNQLRHPTYTKPELPSCRPSRRSGCSPAEPCPPDGQVHAGGVFAGDQAHLGARMRKTPGVRGLVPGKGHK